MSFRELSMIEVKEVLRRHQAGQGAREIARATGLDRKTVRRYLAAAHAVDEQTTLTDDVVHEVADVVQARPAPEPSEPRRLLAPHLPQIERWLTGMHDGSDGRALRLTKVHTLLARQGIEVTYATLRRYVIDELGWRKRTPTVRVDDPVPGDEAQIDFGYMGMLHDETTGRARKLWVLIVTLTCSRYQFVWPTFSQTTEALCEGLDAAWWFFEGVPRRWVIDNMSSAVDVAHRTSPLINDVFADYAQARGGFVDTARVRHPQDKPRVENQVAYVRESWWDGERFWASTTRAAVPSSGVARLPVLACTEPPSACRATTTPNASGLTCCPRQTRPSTCRCGPRRRCIRTITSRCSEHSTPYRRATSVVVFACARTAAWCVSTWVPSW